MPPVTRALAHNTMALLLFLPVSVFAAGSAGEPVTFRITEETRVMLFNSIGQLIFNQITADPEVLIDLPGITSGMYIVKAVSESRQFSQKIVIK